MKKPTNLRGYLAAVVLVSTMAALAEDPLLRSAAACSIRVDGDAAFLACAKLPDGDGADPHPADSEQLEKLSEAGLIVDGDTVTRVPDTKAAIEQPDKPVVAAQLAAWVHEQKMIESGFWSHGATDYFLGTPP